MSLFCVSYLAGKVVYARVKFDCHRLKKKKKKETAVYLMEAILGTNIDDVLAVTYL